MCVGFIEYRVRRTEIMENLHHPLHVPAFLRAGEEFSVGERTCAAFAEAVVGLFVQAFVPVQQRYIFLAFAHFLAPFVDDGFDPVLE